MLNEIFKGMDNASEAINENFNKGSIVSDNLDSGNIEDGFYIRYGNGLVECFKKVPVNQMTTEVTGNMFRTPKALTSDYPIELDETLFVDCVLLDAIIGWATTAPSGENNRWWGIRVYSSVNNQVVDDVLLYAVGILR